MSKRNRWQSGIRRPAIWGWAVAIIGVLAIATPAWACPFCAAVSQTFSEELASMDVVVFAQLESLPPKDQQDPDKPATAHFKIIDILKGKAHLQGNDVEAIYFGDPKPGQVFLMSAVDPPKLMWSTPLPISDTGRKYLSQLDALPKGGAKRLVFFQGFLEHDDEMLARDAYDEFAKAPYADVIGLKKQMNHDQLIAWIEDPDIPASRRRLYLTMLGVCGGKQDLPMLEKMMRADDRKARSGLDAMIACYLTLRGADGVGLVEDLFLKNQDAEYADTYAAIMALRFHGTEVDIVPRERILQALHHMLDRPQLADLVIPDLARWEDWSQMDRLVKLFVNADEKTSWVRVPVVNYLRACPLPEAEERMKELEKVDPDAIKRANTFFPFGAPASKPKAS